MALYRTVSPTTSAITLAEAKLHLRVEHTDDDALITELIASATSEVENYTGRAVMPQTWQLSLDEFPDAIELAYGTATVNSITYTNTAGTPTVLSSGDYAVDNSSFWTPSYIVPAYGTSWPTTQPSINAVVVNFSVGWAAAASVPPAIKHYMKLHIAYYYRNREGVFHSGEAHWRGVSTQLLDRFRLWPL